MRLHAQLSKADELLKAAGGLAGAPDNVALLVPGEFYCTVALTGPRQHPAYPHCALYFRRMGHNSSATRLAPVLLSCQHDLLSLHALSVCICLTTVNKAFETSKVSVSSQADVRKVLEYHTITPARPATDLRSGTRPTLLSGHTVRVDSETRYTWRVGAAGQHAASCLEGAAV
jgi:hypothetical protein